MLSVLIVSFFVVLWLTNKIPQKDLTLWQSWFFAFVIGIVELTIAFLIWQAYLAET